MFVRKVMLIFVIVVLLELQVKANVLTRPVAMEDEIKVKHQYGSPLSILGFEQVNNNTNVVVDNEALELMFLHPEVKDRKVVIVSIIGAFRKGKSFFMNYCLRFMYANYKSVNFMTNPINDTSNWMGVSDEPLTGFSWKSGGTRDTSGIILWSDVFLTTNEFGEEIAIVLIDTQGLFDSKTSPADNSRIFALGTLISSVQIFNLNGVVQENQLQYLQLATDYAKLAANDSQQTFEVKPFQKLLFLIRDWPFPDDKPYGFVGGNSYIDSNLKIEDGQHESLKSVREYIRSSFDDISCSLLPLPGSSVTRANFDGRWSKMDEEFKDELKILIETLLDPKKLVIKKINNQELSAADLKNYMDVYFKVFQSNEIVGAQTLYEITVTEHMNILIQKGLQTYKENLINIDYNITDIIDHLNKVHGESKQIAMDQFAKAQKMGNKKQQQKFQQQLDDKIEQNFSDWKVHAIKKHKQLKIEKKESEDMFFWLKIAAVVAATALGGPVGGAAAAGTILVGSSNFNGS